MHTSYFLKEHVIHEQLPDIEGFLHSLVPKKSLQQFETLYIDLTKNEEELLKKLHRTNRNQIMKAAGRGFHIEVIENPTIEDIRAFQKFYNAFAKLTNTYPCNSFHVNTMSKLKAKNALIITRLMNKLHEVLCYRVYVSDRDIVFSLYSASYFRLKKNAKEKRLLSEANRYLLWRNVIYFKKYNHKIYDMGGLTTNENIRDFKLGFGGEITQVYSGYEANSKIGKLILWLREKKMRKG